MSSSTLPQSPTETPPISQKEEQPQHSIKPSKDTVRESGKSRTSALTGWFLRTLPTLGVLAVLAGLGFWGHRTDWQIPTFSEVSGAAQSLPDDWCVEHGVPESQCVSCNPDDYPKPKDYGWCEIHGVHGCPLHHPDVAQLKKQPGITQADLEQADRALKLRPRLENNSACTNPGRRIQFVTQESMNQSGVDVDLVERAAIVESISVTGEIRYDETRRARLSSKSSGTIWRVEKQVGEKVKQGEILAIVDAAEVGRTKAQLIAAIADEKLQQEIRDRLRGLEAKGIVPGRQLQESEAALSLASTKVLSAQQALINLGLPISVDRIRGLPVRQVAAEIQFLGLPKAMTEHFDPATTTSNLLPVTSPLNGIVATRYVVAGEVVDPAKVLFELVDTRQLWLILNVPLEEAKYVHRNQKIEFLADDSSRKIDGRISWISTTADPKSRTVQVRANLTNSDNHLRSEMFGLGQIILREEENAVVIPHSALMWDGSCHVVFVRDKNFFDEGAPKVFHTRSVRPGAKSGKLTEIIVGILPGEVVVTKGTDVLRSQLLKNNLGAG